MSKEVKISDYQQDRHEVLIAFNMLGIKVDYITLDLMWDIFEVQRKKGGKTNITDCVKIKLQHEKKWEKYFENQNNKNK